MQIAHGVLSTDPRVQKHPLASLRKAATELLLATETIAWSTYSEKYFTNRNTVEIDIRENDPRISSLISIKIKFRIFNYETSLLNLTTVALARITLSLLSKTKEVKVSLLLRLYYKLLRRRF